MNQYSDEYLRILTDIQEKVSDLASRMDRQDSAIRQDLALIRQDVERLREMTPTFVTKVEYEAESGPVKKIVYGLVGIVLTAVVLYIILDGSGIGPGS